MTSGFAERAPLQARSRDTWERVLLTASGLFEAGGWEALTIAEVCRRSGVSAPSIYARVDGRAGLFAAVYQLGLDRMRATEDRLVDAGAGVAGADDAAARAVGVITCLFRDHAPFLRAVISHSVDDPELLEAGARESRRMVARLAAALDSPSGDEIVRVLYSECVLRTMYGEHFLVEEESFEDYQARLHRLATALLAQDVRLG
ncbi:TetR/AcrR family transcriptional regulator [Leifsonia sp. fls2-241-R2A-40a]|uniref:TetR/AcrR family transcriptional regulator n=1 Tax=Leifsonia sp. fls2-241-R2A-40a TaxID=3040290 RepID=UPI00254F5AAB|nr:TetR/AcrR family transcriptional regulator [Leifsonia sp. fls2-241-R2A-40a]